MSWEPPFSEAEYGRRAAAVRAVLEARGLDAAVCYGARGAPGMVEYLAAFSPRWETYLILPRDPALPSTLLVQLFNHVPNARLRSTLADTRWGGPDSALAVAGQLAELGLAGGRVGLAGPIPQQRHAALLAAASAARWEDVSGPLGRLRWVKSGEEIACLRRAAALTDRAVAALAAELRPGLREWAIPAILQAAVADEGGQIDLCFVGVTPMDDPGVCVPAQNLTGRPIQAGDVVITEIGVAKDGYAGQIHRPFAVGAAPSPAYAELYEVAVEAYQAVCGAIRPGATAEDVLEAAELINARGYSICDDLVHGFGGGYLPPVLRTRQTEAAPAPPFSFAEGMCIVVQPNVISHDGRMGLQVGQLHVVTAGGLEPLHQYPMAFAVVG